MRGLIPWNFESRREYVYIPDIRNPALFIATYVKGELE